MTRLAAWQCGQFIGRTRAPAGQGNQCLFSNPECYLSPFKKTGLNGATAPWAPPQSEDLERILLFAERWIARTRAADTIPHLLRDVFLRGEITRGEATRILQKPERTARRVLGTLIEESLLVSDAPGAPVRLGFPATLVGYYFPRLYPAGVELDAGRMSQ